MDPPAPFDASNGEHHYNGCVDQVYTVRIGSQVTDPSLAPVLLYIPGTTSVTSTGFDVKNPVSSSVVVVVVQARPPKKSRRSAHYESVTPVWVMHLAVACRAGGRKCVGLGFSRGGFWLTQMAGIKPDLFDAIGLVAGYCSPHQGAAEQLRLAHQLGKTKVVAYVLLNDGETMWQEYKHFFNELIKMGKSVYLRMAETLCHSHLQPIICEVDIHSKSLRNVEMPVRTEEVKYAKALWNFLGRACGVVPSQ